MEKFGFGYEVETMTEGVADCATHLDKKWVGEGESARLELAVKPHDEATFLCTTIYTNGAKQDRISSPRCEPCAKKFAYLHGIDIEREK